MKLLKTIGTHSGTFHADEVMATTLLTNFTSQFKGALITRTRDQEILKTLDLIADVGGVYDPTTHRYDHHQKGFTETFSSTHSTKLSSAGLIFKHFGEEIVQNAVKYLFNEAKSLDQKLYVDLTQADLLIFIDRLYADFFEYLDAIDNGVPQYPIEVKPRYKNHSNDLVARVSRLNWNDFSPSNISTENNFELAMALAKEEFLVEIRYIFCDMFIGIPIVRKAFEQRFEVHSSGRILFLDRSCSWKSALFRIEDELKISGQILFILFKEKGDGSYRVQSVPKLPNSFELRKSLRDDFKGLRDAELSKVSGVSNCIFCHISGFIGGAKNYEESLQLAVLSLE